MTKRQRSLKILAENVTQEAAASHWREKSESVIEKKNRLR